MFYVPELNLKGKGPLSRLWQASHSAKNVNRKIATEFKYEDGFEAIIRPSNPQGFALRLRGKLLLGISRMHRAKVHYFSEDIQQTHDRISLSLKLGCGVTVDLQTSKKSKTRIDAITMTVDNDYDVHFDLADDFPEWLASEALELPVQISEEIQDGQSLAAINRRSDKNRSINLPDRMSELGYPSATTDDIFSDMLEVPGGDLPPEFDFISESAENISKKALSNDFSSLVTGSAEEDHNSLNAPVYNDEAALDSVLALEVSLDKQTKLNKRKRKTRLQSKTEIDRDTCRKWVSGLEEHMMLIVKKPRIAPYSNVHESIEYMLSNPLIFMNKSLKNHVMLFGLENNPELLLQKGQEKIVDLQVNKARNHDKLPAKNSETIFERDEQMYRANGTPPPLNEWIDDVSDSRGCVESDSFGDKSSILQEWPERMRAGSMDGSLELDLKTNKSRRSSDALSLQGRFEFDQSPRASSALSNRSRLASVGEMDTNYPFFGPDGNEDESIFKDQSLQEEPDTQNQSMNQSSSNKRLSNNDLHVARCVANELTKSNDTVLSFFHLVGRKSSAQHAARVFYSMLALQNDNIVLLEQKDPFSDITIGSTANTSMYAYCPN